MSNKNFTYGFETAETPNKIYNKLLDLPAWWSGIYSETIEGKSQEINDEFTFKAAGGAHYSKQKLVELIPDKKIVWLVTECNLSFLTATNEWLGTKICFDIIPEGKKTKVTFTHIGLVPKIECYEGCAAAWSQYMENLESSMN